MAWWNDIKEIKENVNRIAKSLSSIDENIEEILGLTQESYQHLKILVQDEDRKKSVELALKTLDKFEDYMKNIDRLNMMINEFKGFVSICRSSLTKKTEDKK